MFIRQEKSSYRLSKEADGFSMVAEHASHLVVLCRDCDLSSNLFLFKLRDGAGLAVIGGVSSSGEVHGGTIALEDAMTHLGKRFRKVRCLGLGVGEILGKEIL